MQIPLNDIELAIIHTQVEKIDRGKEAENLLKVLCAGIVKRANKEGNFSLDLKSGQLVKVEEIK